MMTEKMPLMLDGAMDGTMDGAIPMDLNNVDDLFGDDVGLSLPVRTQSKQLHQRLDELRSRGCCQAIAWSRSGTIASIAADGQALELQFLRCHPDNGLWDLSEPTTCDLVKGTGNIPLVHLEWGATNSPELAVVDSVGRVTIVSFSISLNHPFITRKWDADPVDDLNAIAGCYWLAVAPSNQQKPYNVMYGPASKNPSGNSYQYESSFVHMGGPSHPHSSKSAMFCVTVGGVMRMFWSQNNNRIEETTMEIESVNSSDELVTHAAMASDKRHLIVALATTSKQLRLLKVEIQWSGPGSQPDKNPLPQNARLNPSLVEKHVAMASWLQGGPGDENHDVNLAELSHLHVLPSILDPTGTNTVPPMVVTVRSQASVDGSFQMAQSIIDRWEAIEQPQNLHPAFEQLGNRRNSISASFPEVTTLRKLDPIIISKVVIGFQPTQFGKVLILTMADGTVEFRDRFTFDEIYNIEDTNKVINLRQVGWAYADFGPCLQAAFSPTYCSMIQINDDGKVRWSKLQFPMGDIGNSMQEAHYGASVAGLTVTAASAMWYQSNYDDMLAIVQPFTSKKRFTQDWITELIRILKIQVDYSEEPHYDSLMRNSPLQSCLSIMHSLGFKGELKPRSFQSKFASVDLNLRNVVILITLASNTPITVREKMSPLDEPEVVDALAGCIKWSLDLLSWLTDCLFALMNDPDFTDRLVPPRYAEMTAYLHERNDVSLHLMLSSSSRSFLAAVCRRIAHLEELTGKAMEFYRRQSAVADQPGAVKTTNPQLKQAYQKMEHVTSSSLIQVKDFEKLLNTLGSDIRQTYKTVLPSMIKQSPNAPQGKAIDVAVKSAQIQCELGMLLATSPPPAFLHAIKKFFSRDLPAFRNMIDPARLFFADFELLGIQDDKRSLAAKGAKGIYVDLFNRSDLRRASSQQPWRRCTRCAAVMEDVFGSRPGFTFVLGQQRKCSCSGYWCLLPKDKLLI